MRCLFLISVLFVLSSSLENQLKAFVKQPNVFASVLAKIEPNESQQTADDVRTLIEVGQKERDVAEANLAKATADLNATKATLDKASSNRADKDNEIAATKTEIERLTVLKSTQSTTLADAKTDRLAKDREVPIKAALLAAENDRIDGEEAIFKSVIAKLEGLLEEHNEEPEAPEEGPEETPEGPGETPEETPEETESGEAIEVNRKLLAKPLLAIPDLMEILSAADPDKVNHLINLLNTLIEHGEEERNVAIKAWNDAVDAAAAAKVAQEAAQAAFDTTTGHLSSEESELATCEEELVGLIEVENLADAEHKAEQTVWEGKKAIYDEETRRITSEEQTFLDAIADLEKLEAVVQLLA